MLLSRKQDVLILLTLCCLFGVLYAPPPQWGDLMNQYPVGQSPYQQPQYQQYVRPYGYPYGYPSYNQPQPQPQSQPQQEPSTPPPPPQTSSIRTTISSTTTTLRTTTTVRTTTTRRTTTTTTKRTTTTRRTTTRRRTTTTTRTTTRRTTTVRAPPKPHILIPNKATPEEIRFNLQLSDGGIYKDRLVEKDNSNNLASMIQDERYSGVLQGMGVNVNGIKNFVKLSNDESLSPKDVVDALSNAGNEDQVMKMGNIIKLQDRIAKESVVQALDDKDTFHSLVKMGVDVNAVKKVAKLKEKIAAEDSIVKVLDDDEAKGMFSNMGMDVNVLKNLSKIQEEVAKAKDVNEVYEKPEYSEVLRKNGISPDKLKVFKSLQEEIKNGKPIIQVLNEEENTLEGLGIDLSSIKNFTKNVDPKAFEKLTAIMKEKDFSMFKGLGDMEDKGTPTDPKEMMKKMMLKNPEKFGIKLPIEDCITETDEEGDCVSSSACEAIAGISGGPCHLGKDYASYPRVCCIHKVECSGVAPFSKDVVYFTSPSVPSSSPCSLTLALNPGVCQVRLDFLDFNVGSLQSGQCSPDASIQISTNVKDSFIPVSNLCGTLSTKVNTTEPAHLYLHIGQDSDGWKYHNQRIVSLTAGPGAGASRWNIKVTQIECDGAPLQAPSGCSQYYNDLSGSVVSLNYDDGQYLTNLDLTTCIKSQPACAIEYNLSPLNIGGDNTAFAGRVNYGLMCSDYLSFAGEKTGICGYSSGLRVTLPVSGYEGFTFRSDQKFTDRESGFKLDYRFIQKCNNVKYFSYPVAKSE